MVIVLLALGQLLFRLRRSVSSEAHPFITPPLIALCPPLYPFHRCVPSLFFLPMLQFHPSPTHSPFTQGSCDPYSPVIIGHPLMLVFTFTFLLAFSAKGLSRISKSSFLSICLSTYPSVFYLSLTPCVFPPVRKYTY